MADMTFKANLLPVSDLGKNLGASNQRWNIYGNLTGNASTADKWKTARTLTIGSTEKLLDGSANISWSHAEIGAIVSNTWTDGTTAGPTIKTTVNGVSGTAVAIPSASASASGAVTTGTQTFAGDKVFNGKLRIEPSYSSLSDSYNEGIRINQANNGWAEIVVGGTKDSASGIADGVWIVGRRGAAGGKTGAVGDFTIEEENSNGSGLTLYKDLGGAFLYSNKAANTASLTIYNAHTLDGYTGWGIDVIAPNMTAGSNNVILVGHSNATKNSAYIGFHYTANNSNDNYLRLGMYAADDLIVAKGNGNVGIGTTSPSYKLHVTGTVYSTGSPGFWNQTATGAWSYLRLHNGSNYWDIATKSNENSGALDFRPSGTSNIGPRIITNGMFQLASIGETSTGTYGEAAAQIREYHYAGSNTDTWGHAPRLAWHWSGRVAAQIGLASNGWLYEAPNTSTSFYRIVCETGTWGISITGNAATATKATQDSGGYDISDWYGKDHIQIIDASSLNANTWYPVITPLPIDGMHWIGVVNELNSGNKPAWASHDSGYTCCVELLVTRSGWGTTNRYTILLQNDQRFVTDMAVPPVGYNQFTNNSQACFYVRGGGKYRMRITWKGTWTLLTSAGTYSSQTIAPVTSYPGMNGIDIQLLDRDKYSRFVRAYGAVWNDYAEMRRVDESIEPGRCVREVGNGEMVLSTERLERGCKIISDTYGFNIGETDECKTPIAVSGRVLVYLYEGREYAKSHIGWPVCSGPDGTVSIMSEEEEIKYPSRIIGTISEIPKYETWGTGNVQVNDRIWIYVR